MTKKDFFIIAIKLFGLYSIITAIFSVLPNTIAFAFAGPGVFKFVWFILALIIIFSLFMLLIFKSENIVKLLKLEHGFDDDKISLGKLTASEIVKIATIIIGGLLIIDNLPNFLSNTYFVFMKKFNSSGGEGSSDFYWVVSALKIILGYILVTNFKFIPALLKVEKNKDAEESADV